MVFEYIEHDLAGLLDAKLPFSESEVKSIIHQLLEALFHCHAQNILHRDLKASNLLITKNGTLKLADFGLSRFTQKGKGVYTNRVITRWYRPPELLLGATEYGPHVDMWSVGCILGELLLNSKAVFPGKSEVEQLDLIYKICGTPTPENWPSVAELPLWNEFKPKEKSPRALREKLFYNNTKWSKEAIDLFDKLLQLDPAKRPSAKECLDHDWFWKNGRPIPPKNLPDKTVNEFSVRQKRGHPPPPGAGSAPQGHTAPQPSQGSQRSHNRRGPPPHHSSSHHQGPPPPQSSSHPPPPHDPALEPPYKRYKSHRGPPSQPPNASDKTPPVNLHLHHHHHFHHSIHSKERRKNDVKEEKSAAPQEKREG
jgi:cyclin-dependent kinase 12/13